MATAKTNPAPVVKAEPTAIAKPQTNGGMIVDQRPAWMVEAPADGIELLSQYIVPPRLRVVQALSKTPLDKYDHGSVVVMPNNIKAAGMIEDSVTHRPTTRGQVFGFVPLFFYPEWILWNPLSAQPAMQAIRERSTDPQSTLARKARDSKLWSEVCHDAPKDASGQTQYMRYVEHLNFIVMLIGDTELAGLPVCMSFARAEHRAGTQFASLIKMRRAALYGCQYAAQVSLRNGAKGKWFGIDVFNPPAESGILPYVQDQEMFNAMKTLHIDLKKAHGESRIVVDHDDSEAIDVPSDAKGEF